MPTITYIEANGETQSVEASSGATLMQAAVDNLVAGIVAECGGGCSCATCHVFIDNTAGNDKIDSLPPPDDIEQELLNSLPNAQPNSRLSCQITLTDDLDGLVVKLPMSQY